jgi:hypothetical protein
LLGVPLDGAVGKPQFFRDFLFAKMIFNEGQDFNLSFGKRLDEYFLLPLISFSVHGLPKTFLPEPYYNLIRSKSILFPLNTLRFGGLQLLRSFVECSKVSRKGRLTPLCEGFWVRRLALSNRASQFLKPSSLNDSDVERR